MDLNEYDDLLRRLTALVVKLDERDDQFATQLEELREFNRQQTAINRQQAEINASLRTLMQRVFEPRHNGQENR